MPKEEYFVLKKIMVGIGDYVVENVWNLYQRKRCVLCILLSNTNKAYGGY